MGINLFNYIDRQILSAVLWRLQLDGTMFVPTDKAVQFKLGLLTSAFLVSFMLVCPVAGWLDSRGYRRWTVIGVGVTVWSLGSGATGLVVGYWGLLALRCLVGVGEAAYGPVASALLADAYPPARRGTVMAGFNLAIPVGSALGFVLGGVVSDYHDDWRPAFWVTFAGLGLGLLCFLVKEMPRPASVSVSTGYWGDLRRLRRTRSFVLCCAGMTPVIFVLGGLAAWVPTYILQRESRFVLTLDGLDEMADSSRHVGARVLPPGVLTKLRPQADGVERTLPDLKRHVGDALTPGETALYLEHIVAATSTPGSPRMGTVGVVFGGIVVLGGVVGTIMGAWLGHRLKARVRGAYFFVSGVGALFALPCFVLFLYSPLPLGWLWVFLSVIGMFLHTGPAFTLIANVTRPHTRATAFAVNSLVVHALGDVLSPPLIGAVADAWNLQTAFLLTSVMIAIGAVFWFGGMRTLDADTADINEPE
jgi:MFS family permease